MQAWSCLHTCPDFKVANVQDFELSDYLVIYIAQVEIQGQLKDPAADRRQYEVRFVL
jgi:hypothetical protein